MEADITQSIILGELAGEIKKKIKHHILLIYNALIILILLSGGTAGKLVLFKH